MWSQSVSDDLIAYYCQYVNRRRNEFAENEKDIMYNTSLTCVYVIIRSVTHDHELKQFEIYLSIFLFLFLFTIQNDLCCTCYLISFNQAIYSAHAHTKWRLNHLNSHRLLYVYSWATTVQWPNEHCSWP